MEAYKNGFISYEKAEKFMRSVVDVKLHDVQYGTNNYYTKFKNSENLNKLKNEYVLNRTDKLPDGRYKFSYQDGKYDYVDLYLAQFSFDGKTLWVDSDDIAKVELVKYFINGIKKIPVFNKIEKIEYPKSNTNELLRDSITGRTTLDGKMILSYKLK